jgi:hypothetical protein
LEFFLGEGGKEGEEGKGKEGEGRKGREGDKKNRRFKKIGAKKIGAPEKKSEFQKKNGA